MKKVLVCLCLAAWVAVVAGCSNPPTPPANTDKEFEKLYKEYSARFYEKVTFQQVPNMTPQQVTAEATRVWDEIFGPHKDLLKRRVEESLKNLDTAQPPQEDLFEEVFAWNRNEPPAGQPAPLPPKQFLWNPIGAAQGVLAESLARLFAPPSAGIHAVMTANGGILWEALDRNLDHPKLLAREGPLLFLVDLTRVDDYYQVDKLRMLQPKPKPNTPPLFSPTPTPPPAASGTAPSGAAEPTPAPAKPAAKATEKPADKAGPARPKG